MRRFLFASHLSLSHTPARILPCLLLPQAADATTTPAPSGRPTIGNMSESYDDDFPAISNIILWMPILLALTVYAIVYGLYNLDPGDTIIYRVTSQRMKMD